MNQLLDEPLALRLLVALRDHLQGQHALGDAEALALAWALVPAARGHTVAVLGLLAKGHERRAREVIGTNRTASAMRAAHEDCARTARKLAEVYAAD